VARVLRSSPQFGVTLAVYEFLQKNSPIKFGDELPDRSSAPSQKWSSFDIGKQNSLTLLGDLALKSP
jgi:solute carrier family 25 aspartate/glutamate transporter 12/13